MANKVDNPNSQDACVYATVAVATVKLELKDLEGARKDLDKSERILDSFDSVETVVHAAFYRVNAEYYQVCLLADITHLQLTPPVQAGVRILLSKRSTLSSLHRSQ